MSFLENNLVALEEEHPYLHKKITDYMQSPGDIKDSFVVEQAKDATNIIGIIRDGRKIMLNSTYRPEEEAKKYAGKICLTENSITVFMGMGNGIILTEIGKKLNKEASLLVYEPSAELFCFVLEHFDMTKLLKDERVTFYVEGMNEGLLSNDLSFFLTNINIGVTVLEYHPKYRELFPEQCEKFKQVFQECRESALTNLHTIINRSEFMTKNAIANVKYLLRSKVASDFVDRFPKDMPVILVAGGPSLDKNYEVLHQAKGKALIIAMDRTARFLLDRGITPDLFCSLDYAKNIELFRDERLRDIPFLYIPDLSHSVLQLVDGRQLIYGGGDYKLYEWLIHQYGKKKPEIPFGGSVATFAFSFARYIGAKRLILVGQDLALTGGKTYAGGLKNARPDAEKMDRLMVPGNVEEMVETRGDFYIYLIWFNQAVREAEGKMEVINATEAGAKIEGTKIMTLQEAVDVYCQKEYSIADIFEEVQPIFSENDIPEVYNLLKKMGKELNKLKKMAKDAARSAGRCKTLTERSDLGKEFKKENKELSRIAKMFDEGVAANLVDRYMEHLLIQKDLDLYVTEDDNEKEMLRLYEKLEHDYNIIYENMDELIEQYNGMLEDVKDEYQIKQ
ncbi:MAG: DUF115 domain-containing protein [Clostridiales bacterium]|nr:DUF115 domain-containing protein [Clostridiales bacterium]